MDSDDGGQNAGLGSDDADLGSNDARMSFVSQT